MLLINHKLKYTKILHAAIAGVVLSGIFSGYSNYFLVITVALMVSSPFLGGNLSIPKDLNFKKTFFFVCAIVLLYLFKLVAEGQSLFIYFNSFFKFYSSLVYYLYFCVVFKYFPIEEKNKIYGDLLYLIAMAAILTVFGEFLFPDFAMKLQQYDGADPLAGRIYGFAGRPSITAFILVVVVYSYFFVNCKKLNLTTDAPLILGFSASFIMVGSGVGFFALSCLIISKFWRSRILWVIIGCALVVGLTGQIPEIEILKRTVDLDDNGDYYINKLIDLKLWQIEYLLPNGVTITGDTSSYESGLIGGDFALPVFVGEVGVLGVFLMFVSIYINTSPLNKALVILFVLSSFHYATFFWGASSLIFGLILAATRSDSREAGLD